jgi:hypothetical protein
MDRMESREDIRELEDLKARIKLIPNNFPFCEEDLYEIWPEKQ